MTYRNSIYQLRSFKIVTFAFCTIILVSIFLIVSNYDFTIDPTYEGFSFVLTAFEFPLKCFAGYLAIVGLISLNHRSEQSIRQILISEESSRFTNYYKHMEEFDNHVTNMDEMWAKYVDVRLAHRKLFPDVKGGIYEAKFFSNEILKQSTAVLSDALELLKEGGYEKEKEWALFIKASKVELPLLASIGIFKSKENDRFTIDMSLLKAEQSICVSVLLVIRAFEYCYTLMCFDVDMYDEKYTEFSRAIGGFLFSYMKHVENLDEEKICQPFGVGSDMLIGKIERIKDSVDILQKI